MNKKCCTAVVLASITFALGACGSTESSRAEKTINKGLAEHAPCTRIPAEIPADTSKIGENGAIALLKAKGLITNGEVTVQKLFGGEKTVPAYIVTDAGKAVIRQAEEKSHYSAGSLCARNGSYQVAKIEAVDYGNDINGRPVATVRARIKFLPEAWLADTKSMAEWAPFWGHIQSTESTPWLYQLLKSGDELYYTGPGEKIK